jgi:hypothetical protein
VVCIEDVSFCPSNGPPKCTLEISHWDVPGSSSWDVVGVEAFFDPRFSGCDLCHGGDLGLNVTFVERSSDLDTKSDTNHVINGTARSNTESILKAMTESNGSTLG